MILTRCAPYDPPVCFQIDMAPAQVICQSGTPGDDLIYDDIDDDLLMAEWNALGAGLKSLSAELTISTRDTAAYKDVLHRVSKAFRLN